MKFSNLLQYPAVFSLMDTIDGLLLEFSLIKSEIEVIKREAEKKALNRINYSLLLNHTINSGIQEVLGLIGSINLQTIH